MRIIVLGVTALFIASKYEEIHTKNINEYADKTDNAYSKDQILEMENQLVDIINFNFDLPLSIDFFGLLGIIYKFNKIEFRMGYFLLEAYLLDLNNCKFKQSQIGLAACYIILGLRKIKNANTIEDNNFIKYYSDNYQINFDIWK